MNRFHADAPADRRVWFRLVLSCLIVSGILQLNAGFTLASPPAAPPAAAELNQTIPEGASDGSAAWGDLDNDGDMDILMTGRNNTGTETFILRNNSGTLTKAVTSMPGTEFGSLALGDYDRDGDLDVFITGQTGVVGGQEVGMARIYANNGSGSFSLRQELAALYRSAGDWGDYDNDGDLDLLVCGYVSGGAGFGALYRNENGTFTEVTSAPVPDVGDCSVQFGDYNADEDQDFVIIGKTAEEGASVSALARVYANNGSGGFVSAYSPGGVWSGSASWFDLENDGDLDLLITGNGGTSGTNIPITRLYLYNGSFSQITTTLPAVWQSSTAWGDYDNDGDLDLLINGLTNTQHITRVYLNAGGGTFNDAQAGLRSGTGAAVAWGHLNDDRSLDFVVTGIEDADTTISTFVYRNVPPVPNTPPSTPALVYGCWDGSSRVYLDWSGASDAQTTASGGITYNLRVGTGPGLANVVNPSASSNGLRLLAEPGNTQSRSDTFLQIPSGDYYWSVQAVDTAFIGGAFAAEGFFGVGVPIAINDNGFYTAENTSIDLPVLANDAAGYGTLSIVRAEDPPHGTVTVAGSAIRYTPDSGYTGPDSFGYYAKASQGYCSRAVVSLIVTGIHLSNSQIPEGRPAGTLVGSFTTSDPDPGETFTYSLVSGSGDSGNSSFTINSNQLLTAAVFDYETQSSYTIRVRASGSLGSVYEKSFTIQVTAPPTDILLSNNSVAEDQPVNTVVGTFSTVDPEPNQSFTYQLVAGAGSTDNSSFNIANINQLRTSAVFDYETKNTYSIRVRTTDNHGLTFEKQFTILVTKGTEVGPSDIFLSNDTIYAGLPPGSYVGSLSTQGSSGHTFTYSLVTRSDCPGSASFTITTDMLLSARTFDLLSDRELAVCIRSTDDQNNLSLVKNFIIHVTGRIFLPLIFNQ